MIDKNLIFEKINFNLLTPCINFKIHCILHNVHSANGDDSDDIVARTEILRANGDC